MAFDKPENFLPKLVKDDADTTLVYQEEVCYEELMVEDKVRKSLEKVDQDSDFISLWGATLSHPDDMPKNLYDRFPQSYTAFRGKTERCPVH